MCNGSREERECGVGVGRREKLPILLLLKWSNIKYLSSSHYNF